MIPIDFDEDEDDDDWGACLDVEASMHLIDALEASLIRGPQVGDMNYHDAIERGEL